VFTSPICRYAELLHSVAELLLRRVIVSRRLTLEGEGLLTSFLAVDPAGGFSSRRMDAENASAQFVMSHSPISILPQMEFNGDPLVEELLMKTFHRLMEEHGYVLMCNVPDEFDPVRFCRRLGRFVPDCTGAVVGDVRPEPGMDDVYHAGNTRPLTPHSEGYDWKTTEEAQRLGLDLKTRHPVLELRVVYPYDQQRPPRADLPRDCSGISEAREIHPDHLLAGLPGPTAAVGTERGRDRTGG
jgi:hypothetical protein